jgi:RimJ/RimL family protein N-acetyltransferase
VLADVQGLFAQKLAEHPEQVGWWGWYMIARPGQAGAVATLIGSVGAFPPDAHGRTRGGYSVLPSCEGHGFATEAAGAVFEWVLTQPGVRVLEATTFERHFASRRILEKLAFACLGVSPDDASAADSDRQGRGRLMLYRRVRS